MANSEWQMALLKVAYLDPGSGSYFVQIMVACLFGAFFSLKLFWSNFRTFFKNLFSKKQQLKKPADGFIS